MHDLIFHPPHIVDTNVIIPLTQTSSWGFAQLGIGALHEKGFTGKGVKVAILDTQIDVDHPDLKNIIELINLTKEDPVAKHGHGIAVAGILAATDDDNGVIGVAPEAEIIAIKTMNENGGGSYTNLIDGIYLAFDHGAKVINMSLGGTVSSGELDRAIEHVVNQGVIVVCAAGNTGRNDSVMHPGRHPQTICVGATNKRKRVSAFSSRGLEIDVVAPGERLITTHLNNSYSKVTGSSFAAPIVSGIACLLFQAGIRLTHDMLQTSIDIEEEGEDNKSGYGLINTEALFELSVVQGKDDYALVKNALSSLQKFLKDHGP